MHTISEDQELVIDDQQPVVISDSDSEVSDAEMQNRCKRKRFPADRCDVPVKKFKAFHGEGGSILQLHA